MPGSTPATSQLDWLSSTTAMIVLSWSKATRDLLKSFSWGIGALRQLFASDDGAISFAACPIPSLRWKEMDSNPLPLARNPAFLRLLHPRSQPICTPILLPLHPFWQRNCGAVGFEGRVKVVRCRHGYRPCAGGPRDDKSPPAFLRLSRPREGSKWAR